MSLVFYYSPMSSATRIHWALEEVGVPYEKVKVDLAAGDQKKPDYLALNPNGKVPLLVADGTPIFESLAILLYLGERYGVDKGLFPTDWNERAEALKWMCWGQATLLDAGGRIMRNTSERFPAEQRNEKAGAAAKTDMQDLLGMLDKALEGKEYLVGDHFTLADLSLSAYLPFLSRIGADIGPYKNLQGWMTRCTTRPAMARVMTGQA
ncbi:MAG: glutathione S-transferase family protein [Minicystis sp.]